MQNFLLREFEKTNLLFIEGAPGYTVYISQGGAGENIHQN
jgi:hypothetical protein